MNNFRFRHHSQTQLSEKNYRNRYILVIIFLAIGAACLLWRLVDLTVVKRAFLQGQGDARTLRTVSIPSYRGMILDRNGEPLAISTLVDSVWINPKEFTAKKPELAQLANLLTLSIAELETRVAKGKKREFIYLKRGLDPGIGATIKKLKIPGLYLQAEFRRYYPEGEVTAHVLGFTNIDDHGQEGLEMAYDQWLQGVPGQKRVLKDRLGHVVAASEMLKPPRPGNNLFLSIDRRIQYFAYRELQAGVEKYQAVSGAAVVLDVATGEILAMVNSPGYNPNNRPATNDGRYRNRAVTDLFEPGSTIKSFSMVSALASGKYKVNSKVDTSPGIITVNGRKVRDEHNNGVLDLTTILKLSSNVGMSKITLSLPGKNLWNVLHKVGFGQVTESGFPGERSGILFNYLTADPFVLATVSFGYAFSVTPLQLIQAYGVLAAQGVKRPVTFVRQDRPPAGEQVMEPKVAQEILGMLEMVLAKGGTAPLARVPGYRVTGKTGTANIVGQHGYDKKRFNSIFVGIAPASQPRIIVLVVLHDPQGKVHLGGYTAGPIFSRIMGESLRLLNIPPDDLASKDKQVKPAEQMPPVEMSD